MYSWLVSLEERQRRAHVEGSSDDSTSTTWLHCSVGPTMAPGEEEETKEQGGEIEAKVDGSNVITVIQMVAGYVAK